MSIVFCITTLLVCFYSCKLDQKNDVHMKSEPSVEKDNKEFREIEPITEERIEQSYRKFDEYFFDDHRDLLLIEEISSISSFKNSLFGKTITERKIEKINSFLSNHSNTLDPFLLNLLEEKKTILEQIKAEYKAHEADKSYDFYDDERIKTSCNELLKVSDEYIKHGVRFSYEEFLALKNANFKTTDQNILSKIYPITDSLFQYNEGCVLNSPYLKKTAVKEPNISYKRFQLEGFDFEVYSIENTGLAKKVHSSKNNCQLISLLHSLIFEIAKKFDNYNKVKFLLISVAKYLNNSKFNETNIIGIYEKEKSVVDFFKNCDIQILLKSFLEKLILDIRQNVVVLNEKNRGDNDGFREDQFNDFLKTIKHIHIKRVSEETIGKCMTYYFFSKCADNESDYLGIYEKNKQTLSYDHINSLNVIENVSENFEYNLKGALSSINSVCGIEA